MKLHILSDLHMEGRGFSYRDIGADVLILAGDIYTKNRLDIFLDQVPKHIKILFVLGNHEFYHSDFAKVVKYHRSLESRYSNFTFLGNEPTSLDNGRIPVFGGTMFTDMKLFGEVNQCFAKFDAERGINDFRCIANNGKKWTVNDHIQQYNKFEQALQIFLKHTEGAKQRLVISHFMPTEQCSNPIFRGNGLNPYFVSNMERYMGWDGYWVCGHGHTATNISMGGTNVIMNPLGYSGEDSGFVYETMIEL